MLTKKTIKIRFHILSATLPDTIWQKNMACDGSEIKKSLPDYSYHKMLEMKESLVLDLRLNTFERQYLKVNELSMSGEVPLTVYGMKKETLFGFDFEIFDLPHFQKNKSKRELSSCIMEKLSGFQMVRTLQENKLRLNFRPIDMVYELVKHFKQNVDYFFTNKKDLGCRTTNSVRKSSKMKHMNVYECYYCSNFYLQEKRFDKHVKYCSWIPKFEKQSLVILEDNYKFRGHLSFCSLL